MTATLQLTRTFGGVTNGGKWQILIDGTDAGSFLWPMYIVSLIKPDLWIILRRE